jgi:GMP synthase-like glutamine amidotransferase
MRVLAVTHGPLLRPELFGDVVRGEGHDLVEWEIPTRGRPPDGFDAVLVFGGRMNVGEEDEHPWLDAEYELLRGLVASGTPLLGICLGSQALAHAGGGRVGPAPDWQAGFYEVELTGDGRADPVLGVLPERFDALLANAYEFEAPPAAIPLARTARQQQGFRLGERAWGVQFHPEVRRDQVLAWWSDRPELPKPLAALADDLDAKLPAWQELGRRLCRAFLAAARS